MHFFYFFAAFLLVNRLRKSLQFSKVQPKWNAILNYGQIGVIVIFIVTQNYFEDDIRTLFGSALLLGIVLYINSEPDFCNFRSYSRAHYPLIGVGFLTGLVMLINDDFYDKYDKIFVPAVVAAFIWIFARWATTKKQREELNIFSKRNTELDILVAERTEELTRQKNELEKTVELLQTTQQQLIQSEKLASLGELTAGIAHEIQNPLNFVNNFSEVNIELLGEMEQELADGNNEEVIAIANDIKQNLEKISHHGKRADGIVKGMLQHSRAGSSTKELTDLNTLTDEYFRLAYHGLRAKDKSFNAELITKLDPVIPKANVLPQDIGRVLLNLFTNAFYAVHQKQQTAGPEYRPTVEVNSTMVKGIVKITVKDNGNGIPDAIKDKIMQPFFTTKPTGQGTGLGLSLSYDIMVKGHGGAINVESKEGEYTAFTISIPL
jgi:two-component system NtrC family sensor kinase